MSAVETIFNSMTPAERQRPEIIDGSRRRRIARGCGMDPRDVTRLVDDFLDERKFRTRKANRAPKKHRSSRTKAKGKNNKKRSSRVTPKSSTEKRA